MKLTLFKWKNFRTLLPLLHTLLYSIATLFTVVKIMKIVHLANRGIYLNAKLETCLSESHCNIFYLPIDIS